jgi:microcystin-dependent protein
MAEPFLGEIRLMSFIFPPKGWALCNGQLLPINQNQALFSLLGTTYGGDGRVNFALPDLRARTPIHFGSGFVLGQQGGEQAHTLSTAEIPTHRHTMRGSSADATDSAPGLGTPANVLNVTGDTLYAGSADVSMNPNNVAGTGPSGPQGQAHANIQPFLTLSFVIALQGIFPSQN